MKLLTLNTHSWLEMHQIHKIKILADFIVSEDIDVIALQEVNQNSDSLAENFPQNYLSVTNIPLKDSNFGVFLMKFLNAAEVSYQWSWTDSHESWGIYDEGVALFSRVPIKQVRALELSESRFTFSDVFRRCALAMELEVNGHSLWAVSAHMNWWLKHDIHLFEHDFASLDAQIRELAGPDPVVLLGDFNNDAAISSEGYQQMMSAGWYDSFKNSKIQDGEFTVHKNISGWEENSCAMRIDYVLCSTPVQFESYRVVFADNTAEAISDHAGILVELHPAKLFAA